ESAEMISCEESERSFAFSESTARPTVVSWRTAQDITQGGPRRKLAKTGYATCNLSVVRSRGPRWNLASEIGRSCRSALRRKRDHHPYLFQVECAGGQFRIVQGAWLAVPSRCKMPDQLKIEE